MLIAIEKFSRTDVAKHNQISQVLNFKFETDLYSVYDGIFVFPMVGGIVHCKQMCDVFTFYFPHTK